MIICCDCLPGRAQEANARIHQLYLVSSVSCLLCGCVTAVYVQAVENSLFDSSSLDENVEDRDSEPRSLIGHAVKTSYWFQSHLRSFAFEAIYDHRYDATAGWTEMLLPT